jgi:hypothetical protein|tara:strand:+ start:303 stop:479 length:177 start_codon:yes stop_codon:yes gene_type:complete
MKLPTIGKTRSFLYKSGKILGDINAVKRGTLGHRFATRISGKITSRLIAKFAGNFKKS